MTLGEQDGERKPDGLWLALNDGLHGRADTAGYRYELIQLPVRLTPRTDNHLFLLVSAAARASVSGIGGSYEPSPWPCVQTVRRATAPARPPGGLVVITSARAFCAPRRWRQPPGTPRAAPGP